MSNYNRRSTGSHITNDIDAAHADGDNDSTPDLSSQIRDRAYTLFETRRDSGMPGDPVSDWIAAELEIQHEWNYGNKKESAGSSA